MMRLEKLSDQTATVLKLSGSIQEEYLPMLRTEILACEGTPKLDLAEVQLVDRPTVRFLIRRESEGVELLNCPLYVREWISRERSKHSWKDME
jgi:hypothetical protein